VRPGDSFEAASRRCQQSCHQAIVAQAADLFRSQPEQLRKNFIGVFA
jgi:hypothetical protein